MRRISPAQIATAGVSVAALTVGGAYTASSAVEDADSQTAAVVNKNVHEVDEHAADGQVRAAEARAAAAARKAAQTDAAVGADETEDVPEEVARDRDDNGNHAGPDDAAGERPDENAFLNPQTHEPQAHEPRAHEPQAHEPQGPPEAPGSNAGGLGPDEHAGDHPNDHATADHGRRKK